MRSGTLATHKIVGMGEAFRIAGEEMAEESSRILKLREKLWAGIQQIDEIHLNGDDHARSSLSVKQSSSYGVRQSP